MAAVQNARIGIYAKSKLPTQYGTFDITVFKNNIDFKEHLAITSLKTHRGDSIPLRIHSECLTSEVFGSLKCDCREQLQAAMKYIAKNGGIILYMRQEGRGIGLGNKIRAYALQEAGFDTVEANEMLGFPDDLRQYILAAEMLKELGICSVRLLTNNPNKITELRENGILVTERIPLVIKSNSFNRFYMQTKLRKSGHLLEIPITENTVNNKVTLLTELA